jgi:hypothetical protein
MPGYRVHLVGGTATFALLSVYGPQLLHHAAMSHYLWSICAAATLFGALFPDIDTKSKGQLIFYRLCALVMIGLIICKAWHLLAFCTLIALVPLLVHHRGLLHNPLFLAGFGGTLYFYGRWLLPQLELDFLRISIFFVLGTWSHLILDRGPWYVLQQCLLRRH